MKVKHDIVYFNNAATSWPKPTAVYNGIKSSITSVPSEPNRSNVAIETDDLCTRVRNKLAKMLNIRYPNRIFFTYNATFAINQVLLGIDLTSRDLVVSSVAEHNSVLRPLYHLKAQKDIDLVFLPINHYGLINIDFALEQIKRRPKLVVLSHASNVTGTVQPIEILFKAAKDVGAITVLDAAQTIGILPFDAALLHADAIVFTGHKYLLGPTGIGGAYISETINPNPVFMGGSGILSESQSMPEILPIKYEPGTYNLVGLSGLDAALDWLSENWRPAKTYKWYFEIYNLLKNYPEITINETQKNTTPVISFVLNDWAIEDFGYILESSYNVICRTGLHCAPLIHQYLTTGPKGCIRISPSQFTKPHDFARLACAIDIICKSK